MNIYCSDAIRQRIESPWTEGTNRSVTSAPVISMTKMYSDYDKLCNTWQVELKNENGSGGIKSAIKEMVFQLLFRLLGKNAQQQTEFNLCMVHLMEDILQEMSYLSKKNASSEDFPALAVCRDPISRTSHLQDLLAVFQYYSTHYNRNSLLLFLHPTVEDPAYFSLLQRTIYEFGLRNVQFIITDNHAVCQDYMNKAFLQISFDDQTEDSEQIPVLRYSKDRTDCGENCLITDTLDIAGLAGIMRAFEVRT